MIIMNIVPLECAFYKTIAFLYFQNSHIHSEMAEFKIIMNTFLESDTFTPEEFIRWTETKHSDNGTPPQLEGLFTQSYLDAIKSEFALLLLNYLRDGSENILRSSQNLNQTPMKKPTFPEKYEYTSPAKTLRAKHRNHKDKEHRLQGDKPHRHQRLNFYDSNNDTATSIKSTSGSEKVSNNKLAINSSTDGVLVPEEEIEIESLPYLDHRLSAPFSSTPNVDKLEKRLGKSSLLEDGSLSDLKKEGDSISSQLGFGNSYDMNAKTSSSNTFGKTNSIDVRRNKGASRRSLDSQINSCHPSQQKFGNKDRQKHSSGNRSRTNSGGRHNKSDSHKQGNTSSVSIEDLIQKGIQSDKQKKKGKNKNRRSDTLPVEDKINEEAEPTTLSLRNEEKENHSNNVARRVMEGSIAGTSGFRATSEDDTAKDIPNISVLNKPDSREGSKSMSIPVPQFCDNIPNLQRSDSTSEKNIMFEEPNPTKVSCKEQLDKIIAVYCYHIENLLVPNLLAEVNHLLLLLTVKDVHKAKDDYNTTIQSDDLSKEYFDNVHNCVYFAANTLERLIPKVLFGFHSLLEDLKKIDRMKAFCPGVIEYLDSIALSKGDDTPSTQQVNSDILEVFSGISIGDSVQFQVETDGRVNFPDSKTFQDFKRQRDLFFNILQDWKGNLPKDFSNARKNETVKQMNASMPSSLHGRSHNKGFGGRNRMMFKPSSVLEEQPFYDRICELLAIQTPTNMKRLATLFQNQLLQDSLNDLVNKERPILDLFDCSVQDQLKKDPVKLRKLFNRYAPSSNLEPCPDPEFPQAQEFYRDFLRFTGGNFCFLEHLKHGLKSSIEELNERVFDISKSESFSAIENTDNNRGENELYISLVKLRILAKFLGYIESLPYKTQSNTTDEKLVQIQIKQRYSFEPCLPLYTLLENSLKRNRLILTLPWIIEYCAVQDYITMKLPYYEKLFHLMVSIYRSKLTPNAITNEHDISAVKNDTLNDSALEYLDTNKDSSKDHSKPVLINRFNAFFLCINLGWLFENKNFPRELFIQMQHKQLDGRYYQSSELENGTQNGNGLDFLTELRPSLLNMCCPYISELKVVLYEFCTGFKAENGAIDDASNRFGNKRRLSTDIVAHRNNEGNISPEEAVNEPKTLSDIQLSLEKEFLDKQKQATCKTITLVAERIASNFARNVEQKIVSEEKEAAGRHIKDILEILTSNNSMEESLDNKENTKFNEDIENEIQSQIDTLSENSYKNVKREAQKLLKADTFSKCETALEHLLPLDMKPAVKNECVRISSLRATREGEKYIQTITKRYFLGEYTQFDKQFRVQKEKHRTEREFLGTLEGFQQKFEQNLIPVEEEKASWALMGRMKEFIINIMKNRSQEDNSAIKNFVITLLNDIKNALTFDFLNNVEENLLRIQNTRLESSTKKIEDYGLSDLRIIFEGFDSLSADLAIVLCSFKPSSFVSEVQEAFVSFWMWRNSAILNEWSVANSIQLPTPQVLTILSSRNVFILSESRAQMETWNRMEAFLGRLLKNRLLLPLVVEEQLLNVLKEDWPKDMLSRFASCLQGVVDSWKKSSGSPRSDETEDFSQILEWLVWFMNQPDDFDSDNNDLDDLDAFPALY